MPAPTVLHERRDGVAWVTFNRPDVLNALNLQARDELWATLDAIELDPEVRVVVFRGAGERAFSAGADISEFGPAPSRPPAPRPPRPRPPPPPPPPHPRGVPPPPPPPPPPPRPPRTRPLGA